MKKSCLFFLIILITIHSCKQSEIDVPINAPGFTIIEAKTYFENNVLTSTEKNTQITVSGSGPKRQIQKITLWEKALTKRNKNRNVVVIPLDSEEKVLISNNSGKSSPLGSMMSMIMYEDTKGSIHTEVIKRIPDDPSEMKPSSFNGMIIVEDWKGNFIKGYRYLNGKISKLSYSGEETGNGSPKTKMLVAICNKIGYRVCAAGYCGAWGYDTYCDIVDNGAPDNPGDPSGGGEYYGGDGNFGSPSISDYPTFYDPVAAEANFNTSINTTNLNPCVNTILTDIQALSTNGNIVGMIYKFSQSIPGFNWKLQNGTLASGLNAGTVYTKRTGTATTTFDVSKFTNSTDLGIARVILHEAVHAYLQAYFGAGIASGKTYNDLIILYFQEFGNTGTTQHNLMVNSFRDDIGDALEEYGLSKGYSMANNYYQDLAWGGLMETTAYAALSQTDKDRIYSRLTTEQFGVDKDGNPSTQLGASTNCP